VHQAGHYPELHQDAARSTKHKISVRIERLLFFVLFFYGTLLSNYVTFDVMFFMKSRVYWRIILLLN
jgi:hypothetical protein